MEKGCELRESDVLTEQTLPWRLFMYWLRSLFTFWVERGLEVFCGRREMLYMVLV